MKAVVLGYPSCTALPHGGAGEGPPGERADQRLGGAAQLHPGLEAVHPTLAFRHFQLLKLKYEKLLSDFAFRLCFELQPAPLQPGGHVGGQRLLGGDNRRAQVGGETPDAARVQTAGGQVRDL